MPSKRIIGEKRGKYRDEQGKGLREVETERWIKEWGGVRHEEIWKTFYKKKSVISRKCKLGEVVKALNERLSSTSRYNPIFYLWILYWGVSTTSVASAAFWALHHHKNDFKKGSGNG